MSGNSADGASSVKRARWEVTLTLYDHEDKKVSSTQVESSAGAPEAVLVAGALHRPAAPLHPHDDPSWGEFHVKYGGPLCNYHMDDIRERLDRNATPEDDVDEATRLVASDPSDEDDALFRRAHAELCCYYMHAALRPGDIDEKEVGASFSRLYLRLLRMSHIAGRLAIACANADQHASLLEQMNPRSRSATDGLDTEYAAPRVQGCMACDRPLSTMAALQRCGFCQTFYGTCCSAGRLHKVPSDIRPLYFTYEKCCTRCLERYNEGKLDIKNAVSWPQLRRDKLRIDSD